MYSLSLQLMNFSFSQNTFFSVNNNFKISENNISEKFSEEIPVAEQNSKTGNSSNTAESNTKEDAKEFSTKPRQNIFERLVGLRVFILLLGIMFLILSYRTRKTLEIYEFYNTDKLGVITFRNEKEFKKHRNNAKKGKFMLFFGLVILLLGLYLFF